MCDALQDKQFLAFLEHDDPFDFGCLGPVAAIGPGYNFEGLDGYPCSAEDR